MEFSTVMKSSAATRDFRPRKSLRIIVEELIGCLGNSLVERIGVKAQFKGMKKGENISKGTKFQRIKIFHGNLLLQSIFIS